MSAALLVFAKAPVPGQVKTRLSPTLAPADAAALYEAFLRDALDRYAALAPAVTVRLHLAGGRLGDVPDGVEVRGQRGRGLGERMLYAFVEAFAAGHDRAVVIGTDHPTLPMPFVEIAFDALRTPLTAVIGPSDDGGYTMLGLNEIVPDLFDMDYSHDRVFQDTLERAGQAGLQPVVLPAHYDVDDGASLTRLVGEWRGGADVGARTADLLRSLTEAGRLAG